jgi:hypothetical protein
MSSSNTKTSITTTPDIVALLQEVRHKVEASLVPSLESHAQEFAPPHDGFDFLQVKNSLLLSYLIDLTMLLKQQQQQQQEEEKDEEGNDNTASAHHQQQNWQRLTEMKVALDKMMRGLDKKLRYQLDKILQQASSSATTYSVATEERPLVTTGEDDPLQYRPHLDDDDEDEDDGDEDDNDSNDNGEIGNDKVDDDDDDDDELVMAKATVAKARQSRGGDTAKPSHNNTHTNKTKSNPKQSKMSNTEKDDHHHLLLQQGGELFETEDGLYRAPRLSSVPYTLDQEDRHAVKEQRRKRRLRASEVAQTLRAQYGDAPEQEDVHGGGGNAELFGKQREAARRLAEREAEKTKYEEQAMVRLTTTRLEKKERKQLMREESSNLAAIADLGNLVRDSRLHDDDDDHDDDHGGHGRSERRGAKFNNKSHNKNQTERYSNGKRNKRQHQEDADGERNRFSSRGRGAKPKNSLQANLYSNSSGGGKSSRQQQQGSSNKRRKSHK